MFDKKTLLDFSERGIRSVRIDFVPGGCAWLKVRVTENPTPVGWLERAITPDGLECYFSPDDAAKIREARIVKAKGEWVFSAPSVTRHCGCGTSFSFSEKPSAPSLEERIHAARNRFLPKK